MYYPHGNEETDDEPFLEGLRKADVLIAKADPTSIET